ncbi:toll/interleukin-1 receptor domain-containing protein [Tistrella mobilis]
MSYAMKDQPTVNILLTYLQDFGVSVWQHNMISPGGDFVEAIQNSIRTADFVIMIVSAAALNSQWFQMESKYIASIREFSDRSITVIPVLLDDVELPDPLRYIAYLDCRGDPREAMRRLASQVLSTVLIDFSRLTGRQFENLVGDLLQDFGMRIERDVRLHDMHIDFRAYFQTHDVFGTPIEEIWLINVNYHLNDRVSASKSVDLEIKSRPFRKNNTYFALISSGNLTSVARNILQKSNIRVIEGVDLKRILCNRPHLVRQYFSTQSL